MGAQAEKTDKRVEGSRRMRACDAAAAVLREHGEPTIMYGDEWLAHQVAKKLGWAHEGPWTTRRVLAALARTPGPFVKSLVQMPGDCCARGQAALCFTLSDSENSHLRGGPCA